MLNTTRFAQASTIALFLGAVTACSAVTDALPAGPADIQVTSVSVAGAAAGTVAKVKAGTPLALTVAYSDTGDATPGFQTKLCLDDDKYGHTCEIPLSDVAVAKLDKRSKRSDDVTVNVPMSAVNPYGAADFAADAIWIWYVYAYADATNNVQEGDEYNNEATSDAVYVLPNFEQSCQGAAPMAIGETVSGSFSATNCWIQKFQAPAVVRAFAAPAGTRTLSLSFTLPSGSGRVGLVVMNAQGDELAKQERYMYDASAPLTLSVPIGIAGTYYVAVEAPGTFQLTLQ